MDIRQAIRNLISAVSTFVTDSELKAQLDQLYSLTIKPESNLEDIQKMMIGLGKGLSAHHRMVSQPTTLPSPKTSCKVSSTSGARSPAFSSGIGTKPVNFGSRIQYTSPFKTIREEKASYGSDGNIPLISQLQSPQNKIKPFENLILELPQKIKCQLGVVTQRNSVPQQDSFTQKNKGNNVCTQQPKESEILKQQEKYQSKISGRILLQLNTAKNEMKANTFKLVQITEKTSEIETCSSLLHNSQLDISVVNVNRKSKNPLFQGVHKRITDQDLYYIQENFKMKKLIVRAKQSEQQGYISKPLTLDIFLKPL